jgi:hypothetical protein
MAMPAYRISELKNSETSSMADFWSAGELATVPGGHGTEYGRIIPTIASLKERRRGLMTASRKDRLISRSSTTMPASTDPGGYGLP